MHYAIYRYPKSVILYCTAAENIAIWQNFNIFIASLTHTNNTFLLARGFRFSYNTKVDLTGTHECCTLLRDFYFCVIIKM